MLPQAAWLCWSPAGPDWCDTPCPATSRRGKDRNADGSTHGELWNDPLATSSCASHKTHQGTDSNNQKEVNRVPSHHFSLLRRLTGLVAAPLRPWLSHARFLQASRSSILTDFLISKDTTGSYHVSFAMRIIHKFPWKQACSTNVGKVGCIGSLSPGSSIAGNVQYRPQQATMLFIIQTKSPLRKWVFLDIHVNLASWSSSL